MAERVTMAMKKTLQKCEGDSHTGVKEISGADSE
jgi:hypothetical protein